MIKLYNTLTRSKQTFRPISDNEVRLYSCGPTVYDYPHIGNWYAFLRWDILTRLLRANGYKVNWVMNITDVGHLVSDADEGEDKLEKGARRERKTAWDVASFYSKYFLEALEKLNFTEITHTPKATEHIKEQIELIKVLESKGYTYIIDDGVYFDTSKFASYAKFANLDIDSLKAGARVEMNRQKRNITDFALWKLSPNNQRRDMEWDSPWGKGFPGWHIECSAMSMRYLGETLDIHCGGIDHVPVHHTNEIAQSEASTGKTFSNYWLHSNHISVDGKKISKSLGNGILLEDIEAKGFSLSSLRMLVIESHYRSQSNFNWASLESAHNRLTRWKRLACLIYQKNSDSELDSLQIQRYQSEYIEAMNDDMNTPSALRAIDAIMDLVEQHGVSEATAVDFNKTLDYIADVFGIDIGCRDLSSGQKQLLNDRGNSRKENNWPESDRLRDILREQGIEVKDTTSGQQWYYADK